MIDETITPLEKNRIGAEVKESVVISTGCCVGASVKDETACCQLDQEKKSENQAGCGCNTPEVLRVRSSCC